MSIIVLAAGQGSRMGDLTRNLPKSLMPFGNSSVLIRLLRQISQVYSGDINVVVGYQKDKIIGEVQKEFGNYINIIENHKYKNDVNILSVSLALEKCDKSAYIFESDCVYDDYAIEKIFSKDLISFSSWFTIGQFRKSMLGGILKSDKNDIVTDLKIVSSYSEEYSLYDKLIGVLKIGSAEIEIYRELINREVKINTKQYYLTPWINNLSILPCIKTELGDCHADAFNTKEDYYKALKLFT